MTTDPETHLLAQVGQRIRARRAGQGLNLDQLARLTGISGPALSLIETGKRDARLTTLARIASALRIPLETLLVDGAGRRDAERPASAQGYDLKDYQ